VLYLVERRGPIQGLPCPRRHAGAACHGFVTVPTGFDVIRADEADAVPVLTYYDVMGSHPKDRS